MQGCHRVWNICGNVKRENVRLAIGDSETSNRILDFRL